MIVICILECVAISAVFGARRFQACWSSMQGRFCGCPYPLLFWGIITPIGLTKWRIMTTPWDLAPHQMQPTYGRYETYAMSGVAN
ncbi:hypothetical protein FJT64_003402 [Amphibalanus amphitrite]|uniref:Uncharacterized protein n=1 Tax=Amphibalanus amphitrite TaxID=1232801 RepID=A0A6A4VUI6_AMPAM|nr:hypothetical protein FJT64_003402 [Amphibalanus amphitrite]